MRSILVLGKCLVLQQLFNLLFCLAIIAALVPGYWTACKTVEELDQCAYEVSFLANRNLKPPTNDAEVVDQCKYVFCKVS